MSSMIKKQWVLPLFLLPYTFVTAYLCHSAQQSLEQKREILDPREILIDTAALNEQTKELINQDSQVFYVSHMEYDTSHVTPLIRTCNNIIAATTTKIDKNFRKRHNDTKQLIGHNLKKQKFLMLEEYLEIFQEKIVKLLHKAIASHVIINQTVLFLNFDPQQATECSRNIIRLLDNDLTECNNYALLIRNTLDTF